MAVATIDPSLVLRTLAGWFAGVSGVPVLRFPGESLPAPGDPVYDGEDVWAHLMRPRFAALAGTAEQDAAAFSVMINVGAPAAATDAAGDALETAMAAVAAALSFRRSFVSGHRIWTERAQCEPDPPDEAERSATGVVVVRGFAKRVSGAGAV